MVRFASFAVSVGTAAAGAALTLLIAGVTGVAGAVAGPARGLPDWGTSLMVRLASFAVSVLTAAAGAGAGAGAAGAGAGAEAGAVGVFSFSVVAAEPTPGLVGFSLIVRFGMAEAKLFSLLSAMIVILLHNVIFFTFSHSYREYNMQIPDWQVIKQKKIKKSMFRQKKENFSCNFDKRCYILKI